MSFNLYIIIFLILNNKYNCHPTHVFFIILLFWLNIFLRVFIKFFCGDAFNSFPNYTEAYISTPQFVSSPLPFYFIIIVNSGNYVQVY